MFLCQVKIVAKTVYDNQGSHLSISRDLGKVETRICPCFQCRYWMFSGLRILTMVILFMCVRDYVLGVLFTESSRLYDGSLERAYI